MSQHIPGTEEKMLPFPDFYEDVDLFFDEDTMPLALHPRQRRTLVIVSIGLLVLLLASVLAIAVKGRPHITYQAQHTIMGDLVLTVDADGLLRAATYDLNFIDNGRLSEI